MIKNEVTYSIISDSIESEEGFIYDLYDKPLFYSGKRKEGDKYVLCFFHDGGSHFNRYSSFIAKLQCKNKKISYYGMDLPGHGLSYGVRGHFESLNYLVDSCFRFVQGISQKNPGKKIILSGTGIGATLCLELIKSFSHRFDSRVVGNILFNPAISTISEPPSFASKLLFGIDKKLMKMKYPFSSFEYKKSMIDEGDHEITSDPLFVKTLSMGYWNIVNLLGKSALTSSYYIDVPTVVALGGYSKVYDLEKSKKYSKGIPKRYRTLLEYDDMKHDLFNEIGHEKIIRDINIWIQNKLEDHE